jgi:hypothetical protein
MWLSRLRNLIPSPRRPRHAAPKPPRRPLLLEQLEDRALPSAYTAGSVADLIADINAANQAGGSNTIVLAANTTFDLTAVDNTTNGASGLPVIANKDNLSITGQGGNIIQRDTAAPAFRLFDVDSHASLTLTNLTLQNGLAFGSGSSAEGGGIYNLGTLSLNGVTVQNNRAQGSGGTDGGSNNGQDAGGGGIWSSGTLTLAGGTVIQSNHAAGGNGTTFSSGTGGNASGGGLDIAGGTASLTGVILNNNSASGGGGGRGTLHLKRSSPGGSSPGGNGGSAFGGALAVTGGSVTLTGDLLENNSAEGGSGGFFNFGGNGYGGGLYADGGATVALCSDTVESNTASSVAYIGSSPGQGEGGGIYIASSTTVYLDAFTVANTINNTDSSGTNGSTANIDGSYILHNC